MATTRHDRRRFQGLLYLGQDMRNQVAEIHRQLHKPWATACDVDMRAALRMHLAHLAKAVAMMQSEIDK